MDWNRAQNLYRTIRGGDDKYQAEKKESKWKQLKQIINFQIKTLSSKIDVLRD